MSVARSRLTSQLVHSSRSLNNSSRRLFTAAASIATQANRHSSTSNRSSSQRSFLFASTPIRNMSAAAASSASSAAASASVPAPVAPSTSAARPAGVGIHAMDMYFPKQYVTQADLEKFNNVAAGKYTIGLGQTKMAFCTDREDIYSVCLSAVDKFMKDNKIPYEWIGRLEVASETILDHSKAIKTHLMSLFEKSGNSDVEGIDSMNACYAGTNALFNSAAWVESSAWDGRYALVVSADIAEYSEGPARPTGGCGVVVMLVGPNAPLAIESARASHMENAWDFYKPHLTSPYPVVDGKFSNSCYLRALDVCFDKFAHKFAKSPAGNGKNFSVLNDANHVLFHAPYNKLVQKSFARLLYNESLLYPEREELKSLAPFANEDKDKSYENVALEKAAVAVSKPFYASMVTPGIGIPQNLGNMYTASLYAGLMSLINKERSALEGKRVLMFSYGSGLAASMFSLRVAPGSGKKLEDIAARANIDARLEARTQADPKYFNDWMGRREKLHTVEGPYVLEGTVNEKELFDGAFYLTERAADGKRKYAQFKQ